MKPAVVFDVNETLLDLAPIREWFQGAYDGSVGASEWFGEMLRLSFVSATTDRYLPFTTLAAHALSTTAEARGFVASEDDVEAIGSLMRNLRPHDDARHGIEMLVAAGFTVAALTNSPPEAASAQLRSAGLDDLLGTILTVDMVKRFKPHASVYRAAADRLGVSTTDLVLIAAHDWDIAGAIATGCVGIFIDRGGRPYSPAFAPPSLVAQSIPDAAAQLIDAHP
jgi:2-haloacid dehalogenase